MDDRAAQYPVNLNIAGWRCLLVGGGPVAAGKLEELLRCGAVVEVVAPAVVSAIEASAAIVRRRPYEPGEAAGYRLVVTATDSAEVNRRVFEDADAAGVLVNSADDPENCSFTLPSRVRRGDLLVTFSTSGRSPAMAAWLRAKFDAEMGPEYGELLDVLATERTLLAQSGRKVVAAGWQSALDSGMLELIREGRTAEAKERLRACLSSQSD
jgi:precorrin-2 dehydrogenase/sirohydrochlorin ferrochelatase